jgi:hypothetical protein
MIRKDHTKTSGAAWSMIKRTLHLMYAFVHIIYSLDSAETNSSWQANFSC